MSDAIPIIVGSVVTVYFGPIAGALTTFATAKLLGLDKLPDIDSELRGARSNIINAAQPLPIAYGKTRIKGSRVFADVGGDDNKYLHMVFALCEGEIEAVDNVYFNDVAYNNARFTGLYHFGDGLNAHLGADSQTADSSLVSQSSKWTSAHQGNGVAYVYVRLEFDAEAFPSIPIVTFDIRGKKVVDVVTGGAATYSNNPANVLYDYLTSTRYGRSVSASEIDLTAFQVAHAACASTVSNAPEPSQAQYTADGIINIDQDAISNISNILTSCRGFLTHSGGTYSLLVDGVTSSTFDFDDSNIIGNVTVDGPSKSSRVNRIRVKFYDEDTKYEENYHAEDDSTYRTEDNGAVLEKQFSLSFTTNRYRVKRIARADLEQSRRSEIIKFKSNFSALKVEVGSVVTVTRASFGWTSKPFRIIEVRFSPDDDIEFTAREYSNDVYVPKTPPTYTAPPTSVLPPVNDLEDLFNSMIEPDNFWVETFEDGDSANWSDDDGSITTTADAPVGSVAGLVTHGGGGETASVSRTVSDAFVANFANSIANQMRVQLQAKQPSADAAAGFKIRIVGSSENSAWQTFATSSSAETFGFNFRPTTPQTSLTIEVIGDSSDTGTDKTIIDNITLFVLPSFIDENNIDQFIGSAAIGTAYIADLAATSAKIADLAVTTAKINDASVETLKIAGQAVTFPQGVITSGPQGITTTLDTKQTLVVAVTGDGSPWPVIVSASGEIAMTQANQVQVLLRRNGTNLYETNIYQTQPLPLSIVVLDNPGIGTWTYTLDIRYFGINSGNIRYATMTTLGAKR
tara:strand:+ start:2185 stop:4578 length:2394 start_codon:yes stop_codon:yes gene_type:complete